MLNLSKALSGALLFLAVACATPGTLGLQSPGDIAKLDEGYNVIARLGAPPIALEDDQVARFAIYERGKSPSLLLIVAPYAVEGEIKAPQKSVSAQEAGDQAIESAARYNSYLDVLLRSHRLLLRGDIKECLTSLDAVDAAFGKTFGSLVLRANVAHIQGQKFEAQKYFKLAKRLHPDATALKNIEIE